MPIASRLKAPAAALLTLWLSGCGSLTMEMPPELARVPSQTPAQWHAPQPHKGQLQELSTWWQQWRDPLMVELIDAAQKVSPSVSAARSQIEQARSTLVSAGAALRPEVSAGASIARSVTRPAIPPSTSQQGNLSLGNPLQPYWELDLFGGNAATRDAAKERLQGTQAQWHDARVAVAAEVASQYLGWRSCDMQALVLGQDMRSRNASSQLTRTLAKAGFQTPANDALAQASAAQGRSNLANQRAQCDGAVKALVALTAWGESALRSRLVSVAATTLVPMQADGSIALTSSTLAALQLPSPPSLAVASVPGEVLAQRPDVFKAERELMAVRFDYGAVDVLRQPQVTFAGNIGSLNLLSRGATTGVTTWGVGPLQVTIPIWDWGKHNAALGAAQARYDDAVQSYLGTVRNAVKEVEQALVNLQSAGTRGEDALLAATGYLTSQQAAQALYGAGLGSLPELEETRRVTLQAEQALLALQLEQANAWVALYRAAGGGWQRGAQGPQATVPGQTSAAASP